MGMDFVLDASVTIRWALQDGSISDRTYAEEVLDSLHTSSAFVPALWYTETTHVLRCAIFRASSPMSFTFSNTRQGASQSSNKGKCTNLLNLKQEKNTT